MTRHWLLASILLLGSLFGAAQEIKRPTANASSALTIAGCSGVNAANTTSLTLAYDAGTPPTTTSSGMSVIAGGAGNTWTSRVFTGWQTTTSTYGSMTININFRCDQLYKSTDGSCYAGYSVNSGSTFTAMASTAADSTQNTYSATIPQPASLSTVQVLICEYAKYDAADVTDAGQTETDMWVFDIWTAGTAATARHRAVVVSENKNGTHQAEPVREVASARAPSKETKVAKIEASAAIESKRTLVQVGTP